MTMVFYRLVGEHGQLRRSTTRTAWVWQCLCVQGVLMLTTVSACPATVAWWYWCLPWRWCKGKQNPRCSPDQAFFNPTNCAVWMASGAGGLQKEISQGGWRKNTIVLGFQAQQDFVLSCAFYSAIQVLKSSARHQLKKSPSSLIFSRYILFISWHQVPSLFFSFATGFYILTYHIVPCYTMSYHVIPCQSK